MPTRCFFRIDARADILGKFCEGGDTLPLQPIVLGSEVAVDLGMTRVIIAIGAKHVLGEEILRVAAAARTHGNHQHRRVAADGSGHFAGHDLDLGGEGAGFFTRPDLPPDIEGARRRSAYGSETASPRRLQRYQPDMTADRDAFVTHAADDLQAGRTIDGVAAGLERLESLAHVFLRRNVIAIFQSRNGEGIWRRFAEDRAEQRRRHRDDVDAGSLRRFRLLQ